MINNTLSNKAICEINTLIDNGFNISHSENRIIILNKDNYKIIFEELKGGIIK